MSLNKSHDPSAPWCDRAMETITVVSGFEHPDSPELAEVSHFKTRQQASGAFPVIQRARQVCDREGGPNPEPLQVTPSPCHLIAPYAYAGQASLQERAIFLPPLTSEWLVCHLTARGPAGVRRGDAGGGGLGGGAARADRLRH
jgi:hypothetical protein